MMYVNIIKFLTWKIPIAPLKANNIIPVFVNFIAISKMLLQKNAQNNKYFLFTDEMIVITNTPPNILPTPKKVPKRPNCLLLKFN